MKRFFFIIVPVLIVCSCKNSTSGQKDNTQDYKGLYTGIIYFEGLESEAEIKLNEDTFALSVKGNIIKGSFSWDETGKIIILNNTNGMSFIVNKNKLSLQNTNFVMKKL